MEKNRNHEISSSLATIEEIQRRLLRPSSLSSYESISTVRSKKSKLEDYLDPILLSKISSKIKNTRAKLEPNVRVSRDFDWPIDDLKQFSTLDLTIRRRDWVNGGAVSLNDDFDGGGEEVVCSPFEQFEKTVLKLCDNK
ncbi:hypothetical protein GIB67_040458 [Kingdonia uniflora]|uniref:Uncharacterized protein n=1 Tax=Kingdonia uniflora TaxID=39325 RepID=A0A7J7L572_9MAGN|nr:hypothetical protein GIB67_040458 [Kingdonia uniflora]